MKRLIAFACLVLLLTGCAAAPAPPGQTQYNATFLTLFDTVTTIVGRAESQEEFHAVAQNIHDELLIYHQLFDIYNSYEGITNLKDVNDAAGREPVVVDQAIIDLLLECREYYDFTGGRVNVAMGSVLNLWHEARNDGIDDPANAYLPDADALAHAREHTRMADVIIDETASTVYLADPDMRLDVGAIAKGWAAQRVAESAPTGLLISVGGNVVATGPKDEKGNSWIVGVQDPRGGDQYMHTLYLNTGSVVTSGDYQRTYTVEGKSYHHIIDPDTCYPAAYWSSVTVVCEDSGLADALSTALFLLSQEEGQALLSQCGVQAMWVDREGNRFYSPGFEKLIRT